MFKKSKTSDKKHDNKGFSEREQRMYDFMKENPVGVLSTVTPDHNPHGVVIYFYIDSYFNIFFITKSDTRKSDNIGRNNNVMLTVFVASSQSVVQVNGKATEIKNREEINAIAGRVFGASKKVDETGVMPITKLDAGSYKAFKIKPTLARMAVYSRPDPGEYEEIFESVESFDLTY